ncbi:hypothetical protein V8C86DRAFT_3026372 [Haematococcus lacustris]
MLLAYHQVKQNFKLSQELKLLIHCGYQCGVTFEVASVPPIPSNVVAGAEGGAHHTGGDLDAPSLPTAPAQATTTFTTSQSCHSLLDSVVVPHQPLECHA